jgi:hypothetical protein
MKSLSKRNKVYYCAIFCLLAVLFSSALLYAESVAMFFQETQGSPWLKGQTASHDFGVSMKVEGPGTLFIDFGGTANCQSSANLSSYVKLFPTVDGKNVGEAMLGTKTEVTASFAGSAKLLVPKGTHVLGLHAQGGTYNTSSPGCTFYKAWIKAALQQK